jgi:hypothetical protein
MDMTRMCQYDSRVSTRQLHLTVIEGPLLLAAYLKFNGLMYTDFAPRCDVSPSAVVRWLDGSRCPRRAVRIRIESLTSGKVSRYAWLTPEEITLEKAREKWLAKTADPVLANQTAAARGWKHNAR